MHGVSVTQRTLDKLKEEWTAPLEATIATIAAELAATREKLGDDDMAAIDLALARKEIATLTAQRDEAVVLKEDAYRYQHAAEDRLTAAEKVCKDVATRHFRVRWLDSDDFPAHTYDSDENGPSCRCRRFATECPELIALTEWRRTKES